MIKKLLPLPPWICLGASITGSSLFFADQAYLVNTTAQLISIPPIPAFQAVIALSYFLSVYFLRNSKNILLSYLPLVIILCIYFFGITNKNPLGDHDLLIAHAFNPNISIAEPISYFLYKWIIKSSGNVEHLKLLPPLFGIFTIGCYFLLTHLLSKNFRVEPWVFKLSLIAMPLPFFYTYGYVENTQLSTSFLILFLWASMHFLITQSKKIEWISWCCLSLFLSLAILIHGQNWFVMPVIFLLPILKIDRTRLKSYLSRIFLSILIFFGLTIILYKISVMQGWQFFPGSALGGGDGLRFVPLNESDLNRYATFTMFSIEHAMQISTIMVFSGFYILAIPVLLLYLKFMGNQNEVSRIINHNPATTLLALASLGYLSFVVLWNFDFGFPMDIDLMLTMGIPFSLFNLIIVSKLVGNNTIKAGLITLSSILSFWILSQSQVLR